MIRVGLIAAACSYGFGANASPNWEAAAEAGVMCRSLVANPEWFVVARIDDARRYWPPFEADENFYDATRILRFGKPGGLRVAVIEQVIGDVSRLSCEVWLDPEVLQPGDRALALDWFHTWAALGLSSSDLEPYDGEARPIQAVASASRNSRDCLVVHELDIQPGQGSVRGVTHEPGALGCGGKPVLSDFIAAFSS